MLKIILQIEERLTFFEQRVSILYKKKFAVKYATAILHVTLVKKMRMPPRQYLALKSPVIIYIQRCICYQNAGSENQKELHLKTLYKLAGYIKPKESNIIILHQR